MKRLIVNADDYGHSRGVSAGIRDGNLRGCVTSTSAMMNMPGVADDLRLAVKECPSLGLGVHLNLTGGCPLTPAAAIPSLVDEWGSFFDEENLTQRLRGLDRDEVETEWRAQIEQFVAVTGHTPDHLDAHHHVVYFHPHLFDIFLKLAWEFECAVRLPLADTAANLVGELPPDLAAQTLEHMQLAADGELPRHPDHFICSFYGDNATLDALSGIESALSEGTTEIMTHPGRVDAGLIEGSSYTYDRERELDLLTRPGIAERIYADGIELINFGDL
jgi:chitin disaccharide deacetylase